MILKFRKAIWNIAKCILFRLDAEVVHHGVILAIKFGILFRNYPLRIASGEKRKSIINPESSRVVFGLTFSSRVGLAAGFDKNAEIVLGLPSLGFGFAEIGTVTPRAQSGNLRPRLFRDSEQQALFNRMGFNNLGASIIADRLRQSRPKLPDHFRIGVNVGKNKETPLEDAMADYIKAVRPFEDLADYLVINVSSPNTAGLRKLQSIDALKPIVEGVGSVILNWKKKPPLLLKLAPELVKDGDILPTLVQSLEAYGVDGWILTNTQAGAWKINQESISGGWSGKPLSELSMSSLVSVRRVSKKPIISVGGIASKADAEARIQAGADLIQIYTGWIYQGPTFPVELH